MRYFYEEKGESIRASYNDKLEYGAHIHSHLELVYMLDGQTKAAVDFREHTLSTGDAFLVFPNQVHLYRQDRIRQCMVFIFSPDLLPEYRSLFAGKEPVHPVIPRISDVPEAVWLLERAIDAIHSDPPHRDNLFRGYLLAFMSILLPRMEFTAVQPADSVTIKRVLRFCAENFSTDISLDSLARALHLNQHYLSHLFRQKLHMGFREYVNMLRVSEACRLLDSGEGTITEIAYQVGFGSTRSFNRAFSVRTGGTPGQYRRR